MLDVVLKKYVTVLEVASLFPSSEESVDKEYPPLIMRTSGGNKSIE